MVRKSANEEKINGKDGKYGGCKYGVVNLYANSVFTIFALDLTSVCTFLDLISTK